MLTTNLHLAVCHLWRQELQHGPVALNGEWWVERGMQAEKTGVGRKMSRRVEHCMVSNMLQRRALSRLGGTGLGATFDQLVPAYRSLPLEGPHYDAGDPATGVQALHKGKLLSGIGMTEESIAAAAEALAEARRQVRKHVRTEQPPAFAAPGSIERATLYVHGQVSRGGRDVLTSRFHSASSRCSAHVAITFDGKQFVGQVQRFLRVVPARQDDPAGQHGPLRLAVVRLYTWRPPRARGTVLVAESGNWLGGNDGPLQTVDVMSIDAALVTATEVGGAGTRDLLRLVKYSNCSRG